MVCMVVGTILFVSPTNLHCSQTVFLFILYTSMFVSPTNLHCSQTCRNWSTSCSSLFPLRIYTALKRARPPPFVLICLFPLRIYTALKLWLTTGEGEMGLFPLRIYTALKQRIRELETDISLFPLRIYTALKPVSWWFPCLFRLFPLRIYTALKPWSRYFDNEFRLFPLRIYTALKLIFLKIFSRFSLFPLRIYTALKQRRTCKEILQVCFPYEFTLLSNAAAMAEIKQQFVSPTNLHCSQTLRPYIPLKNSLFPLRIYTALKPQTSNCPRKISAKYLCNIPSFFRKHFYFNIKYIDLHPL